MKRVIGEKKVILVEIGFHCSSMGVSASYTNLNTKKSHMYGLPFEGIEIKSGDRFRVSIERIQRNRKVRPQRNPFRPEDKQRY